MRLNMKAERARNGLSAKEVAEQIKVHENALLRWESGETEPLGSNLINLSDFYSCSPEYLLEQTDERQGKVVAHGSREQEGGEIVHAGIDDTKGKRDKEGEV